MDMFIVAESWKSTHSEASAGILAMRNVANPDRHTGLEKYKAEFENELRSRFSNYDRAAIKALPTIQAYNTYYKRYKKTYHVQLQIESVALKGKPIPSVSALVEAMFMAELKNLLLTAGHDLAVIQPPVRLEAATGTERYTLMNGKEQVLKSDDMIMADNQGVISSVLYGPDRRTRISSETRQVFFGVYAPPGIDESAIYQHLQDIQAHIMLFAPEAEVEHLEVYGPE
jgi:DNA/RNA-binding domain of Phe-tRNA-synthetase-like protein